MPKNMKGNKMRVMTLHDWFDENIGKVTWYGHEDVRELVLSNNSGSILISKQDVIALAKEFNLLVFEEDSSL